jgi:hypothetical protein
MLRALPMISDFLNFLMALAEPKLNPYAWPLPVLIVLVGATLLILNRKFWARFATHRKVLSRLILFATALIMALLILWGQAWVFNQVPIKYTFESPNIIATAIKIGIYNLMLEHEAEVSLSGDRQELLKCVKLILTKQGVDYQKACNDNSSCYDHIPVMSKEKVISTFNDNPKAYPICKNVDITKL